MKLRFVFLALLLLPAAGSAQTVRQTIKLQKMALPVTARPAGISNLFFCKDREPTASLPDRSARSYQVLGLRSHA
jgi:hypothetical protein